MNALATGNVDVVLLFINVDAAAITDFYHGSCGAWFDVLFGLAEVDDHLEVVTCLLDAGADPNAVGAEGPLLQTALQRSSDDVVRLLRSRGAWG